MKDMPIIDFKNVNIYHKENLILSNINLSVNKGEFIYFIGKVGSGKTSLIRTFNAELTLKNGSAMVAGFDLTKIKRKQIPYLRRKLGIVFQDFKLLSDRTVHDNLLFVLKSTGWKNKKEIDNRINEVLEKVGLAFKGYKMPHQLSGGEQQRVVIARALLNDPELILADEPTGNLDPETSENLMELLFEISQNNRTVIMATHDYNMVKKFVAKTLKFENTKVIEVNNSNEIDFESLKE